MFRAAIRGEGRFLAALFADDQERLGVSPGLHLAIVRSLNWRSFHGALIIFVRHLKMLTAFCANEVDRLRVRCNPSLGRFPCEGINSAGCSQCGNDNRYLDNILTQKQLPLS
jgi:hypothetical protein